MSRTATAPHTMYSGRGAQLYDRIVAGDVTEIADIVRRIDRGRSRVLELASGSGRITLPLLRVAGAVTAVDLSPDLTDILRARAGDHPRLRVVCADILTWESTDVFDTVVLGTTSIALFDGDDRRRILERVRDWLTPEGELILTLRTPPMPRDDDVVAHGIGDGMTIREEFDRVGGVLHTTLVEGDDGYSVSTFIVSPETLIAELEAAGLAVRHLSLIHI